MTRLFDALHRAGRSGETPAPAADELTQFLSEQDRHGRSGIGDESVEAPWGIGEAAAPAPPAASQPPFEPQSRVARDDVAKPIAQSELVHDAPASVARLRAIPSEAARHDSDGDVRILDVIRLLSDRWKLIAFVVAATLSVAVGYNVFATRLYEASARLLVDIDSPVMPFHVDNRDTSRLDYYVTQLEVLRSPGLARKALGKLGLLSGDEAQQSIQVGRIMQSLNVSPVKSDMGGSRVINVTFRSTDPGFAAKIANGLAQAYVDQNLDMRRQGSLEASAWLTDRLADLRNQVTARDGALQQYREQKNAVSLDDRQNIVVQKLAQLNAAVTAARTETGYREAEYRQLVAIQQKGAPVDTFPPIIANSFIQGLKADLANLQRERTQLAENLGDLHPDMIKINTAIEAAERRLNAEMAKVIEGVNNDYKASQAKEASLVAALENQTREVLNLNQKAIAYSALQRDASSTQQIFESVLQRVKETDLSAQLTSNNVRILDAADVPRTAVLPHTRLNLIAAVLGGSFLAILLVISLEYLNPRISNTYDVLEAFGLPLLGVAPRMAAFRNGPLTPDRLPPEFQEALRSIRTRILLSPMTATSQSLALTSATSGEGKTALSSSLATSLAQAGRRVLLIDADMRRSQLHRAFDLSKSPGLSNILAGQIKAPDAVRETKIDGLSIVPAGDYMAEVTELLTSEALTALVAGFADRFDLIVVDCPPVMSVADASIIANATSSVVFIVGAGTARDIAQAAIERLTSVQAHVVGVILNKAKLDRRFAYDSYLYHQSA